MIYQPKWAIWRPAWLIRILTGREAQWESGSGSYGELAASEFSKIDEDVSVYCVRSDIDECRVVAAHQLANTGGVTSKAHLLRLLPAEVKRAGLTIKNTDGNCGVDFAVTAHRDLSGDNPQYETLVQIVLDRQLVGCDRVRKLHRNRLLYQLRQFMNNSESMTDVARARCTAFLGRYSAT